MARRPKSFLMHDGYGNALRQASSKHSGPTGRAARSLETSRTSYIVAQPHLDYHDLRSSATPEIQAAPILNRPPSPRRRAGEGEEPPPNHENNPRHIAPPPPAPQHSIQPQNITPMTVSSIVEAHQNDYPYPVYTSGIHPGQRALQPAPAPPQTWQQSVGIAPQQTHLAPPPMPHLLHRPHDGWNGYEHPAHPSDPLVGPSNGHYDYRYRDEPPTWVGGPDAYYGPVLLVSILFMRALIQPFHSSTTNHTEPLLIWTTRPQTPLPAHLRLQRSRLRNGDADGLGPRCVPILFSPCDGWIIHGIFQPAPAPSAASLVVNKNPPARSPSPPARVIKSTYGGNLFTADDVLYLKRYIDYCQEQGLVLRYFL